MSKKTVRKDPGSRKASPKKTKGLIAKAKNAGQSEQEECALDNRSHRTPGARHAGRRQSGWATSFEHGILCPTAHEEAVEVSFYQQPTEDHGPGGSAPHRVWLGSVQTPGIPLPLALPFFRGGVTGERRQRGPWNRSS
jgi:hypothetical protein